METKRKRKCVGDDATVQGEEPSDSEVNLETEKNSSSVDESVTDPATLLDKREEVAYPQESDLQTRDNFQLTHIPMNFCSMVAFACN